MILSEKHRLLQKLFREFAEREFTPELIERLDETGEFDWDIYNKMAAAGIMGAKKTPDIIPMCHPIMLSGVDIEFTMNEELCSVDILATAKCTGATGVEMEALTAVTVAALTVYDMCKAVQKDMQITDIRLLRKTGGKSGDFINKTE